MLLSDGFMGEIGAYKMRERDQRTGRTVWWNLTHPRHRLEEVILE